MYLISQLGLDIVLMYLISQLDSIDVSEGNIALSRHILVGVVLPDLYQLSD